MYKKVKMCIFDFDCIKCYGGNIKNKRKQKDYEKNSGFCLMDIIRPIFFEERMEMNKEVKKEYTNYHIQQ